MSAKDKLASLSREQLEAIVIAAQQVSANTTTRICYGKVTGVSDPLAVLEKALYAAGLHYWGPRFGEHPENLLIKKVKQPDLKTMRERTAKRFLRKEKKEARRLIQMIEKM